MYFKVKRPSYDMQKNGRLQSEHGSMDAAPKSEPLHRTVSPFFAFGSGWSGVVFVEPYIYI